MGIFRAFFPLKNLMNHHESPWFLFAVCPHSKWSNPPLFNNRFRGKSPRFTTPPCGVSGTSCSWYCRDPWRSPWIKNLPISRNSQGLVSSCKFSNHHITDIIQHVTWPWHTVTYGGFLGSIHLRWFNPRPEAIRWLVHEILATTKLPGETRKSLSEWRREEPGFSTSTGFFGDLSESIWPTMAVFSTPAALWAVHKGVGAPQSVLISAWWVNSTSMRYVLDQCLKPRKQITAHVY